MREYRATINILLGEHKAIRGHLDQIRGLAREWDGLLAPRECPVPGPGKAGLSPAKLKLMQEKRSNLSQAIGYLEDGLRNHHIHEDEVMSHLLGDLLMKSIRFEHAEMMEKISKINAIILIQNLESFLERGASAMQMINELCDYARSHSTREDGILQFLKKLPEVPSAAA